MPRRTATNRIQSALDELGIDWHSPRYGRPRVAGDAHTILIPDGNAFGPLVGDLVAVGDPHLDPRQPPARMRADAWERSPFWRNAARYNGVRVAARLEAIMGPASAARVGAVETWTWRDQAGRITVTSWTGAPRFEDLDDGGDPRLSTACSIDLVPGWRRPLSIEDLRIVEDMAVVGRGSPRGVRTLTTSAASDDDIGYVREPGPGMATMDAVIGVEPTSRTLVACPGKLMIIPLDRITTITHETFSEGVSAGHARLIAHMADGPAIAIAEHDETHGLELVARGLARALNLPIERLEAVAS